MQIGETIRTYRKKCGLTQEEMANRLGVTAPAVNKWEKGNSLPDVALIMDAWRMAKKIPDDGTYEEYFRSCYERALESREENVRISAAGSLYGYYMRNEQYEKAEEYLAYYSERDPERKRKQAEIYSRMGRTEEAYKANEELLMQLYQTINMTLSNIYLLDVQEKDMERAHQTVEKLCGLSVLFDMGEYQEWASRMDLAIAEQDVEATLETAAHLLSGVDGLTGYQHSCLFAHLKWKPLREEFKMKIRSNLLENFREEEKLDYMKGDKRWQELVKKQDAVETLSL